MSDTKANHLQISSKRKVTVLGDVEVESVIMRDPEETITSVSTRAAANAGKTAYFYFRMPGGAWMLEESIQAALAAADPDSCNSDDIVVDGFDVARKKEDSLTDSSVSVWSTLAPRSAIQIDLFPRLPDDEKDKVFRIRAGHVTGWMQRAIEGLPKGVANILHALRAFGGCYKFYRDKLKQPQQSTGDINDNEKECFKWLVILKMTLYAYIADDDEKEMAKESQHSIAGAQNPIDPLLEIGKWLHKSRSSSGAVLFEDLIPPLKQLLDCNLNYLAQPGETLSHPENGDATPKVERCGQQTAVAELRERIRQIEPETLIQNGSDRQSSLQRAMLLAEYALVLSMKTQLVRMSIHSKQWAIELHVEEKELTAIGDQLWHVCNQLCCCYFSRINQNGTTDINTDPLSVLPRAILTMFRVAKTDPKLGVAHRSAENALLYAHLWQAFCSSTTAATDTNSPSVIVINDKDHGFRWYSPLDLYQWLIDKGESAYIVWNMASPLADGQLWEVISGSPNVLRRTVLIVDEDDLRQAGVDLGRAGSAERTFQEFWEQLYSADHGRRSGIDSILVQLAECKALVICFDGGVLYYSHDGGNDPPKNEVLRMYSLSPKSANGWPAHRPDHSGEMFGEDLIVAASITTAIVLQLKEPVSFDLLTSIDYGCRLSTVLNRAHLDSGYAPPSQNQVMYSERRPQPFTWLFQHWFLHRRNVDRLEWPAARMRQTAHTALSTPAQSGSSAPSGIILSPFVSNSDQQMDNLIKEHDSNLDKALNAIVKNCKFTRLCSYLCKSDHVSPETLKLAFERIRSYSRISEFHAPIVLNGSEPYGDNRRPVESFATIDAAAEHIVKHGLAKAIETISEKTVARIETNIPWWVPRLDSSIPKPQYSWLTPLIRWDIDNYSDISMLVRNYVLDENRKRPLSLAVFGAPGSGKNTTIEALIAKTDESLSKNPCTFNLSQFSNEKDLATAFHQVQDMVLTRKGLPPVIFFDEFDCSFNKEDWGWLKFFLAPMQDGEYRSGENTYHIGRAIFIFSGGISRCYADFEQNMTSADEQTKARFEKAKGPDFVSRLRGHLDIPSINTASERETPDNLTKIRRALILRSILERTLPQIFDPISKEAWIDSRIIRAMLGVPRFRHEVRSMQAIIEMSHVPKNGQVFSIAELPSEGQLSMHVEVLTEFDKYLRMPS